MRGLLAKIVGGGIEVLGDVEIAFEDVFRSGPGVLVIAGTGSIAYGRNMVGETARAGGWGHTISDEGSGYWIGVEAVKAALRIHDAQNDSALLEVLMDALGAKNFDDFIVRLNANPQPDYATLFPIVQAEADRGDDTMSAVLSGAGLELAHPTATVLRRLFRKGGRKTDKERAALAEVSIAMYGSVLAKSVQVRQTMQQIVRGHFLEAKFLHSEVDAARGALNRARRPQPTSH